ncbi:MAG: hypothetical protein ACRDGL_04465 [Candidatus Limnocylindrales bacterium]
MPILMREPSITDPTADVLRRLERLGVPHYLTGSEAMAFYASPRQTMDADIVVALRPQEFGRLAAAFAGPYLVAEPIVYPERALASLISVEGLGKVDLILRVGDRWGDRAMARRVRMHDARLGDVWVSSPEDLVLAKMDWSAGTSELQLRDCRDLVRLNPALDVDYIEGFVDALGLRAVWESVRAPGS